MISLTATAQEVCQSLPECLQLKALVEARIDDLQARMPRSNAQIEASATNSKNMKISIKDGDSGTVSCSTLKENGQSLITVSSEDLKFRYRFRFYLPFSAFAPGVYHEGRPGEVLVDINSDDLNIFGSQNCILGIISNDSTSITGKFDCTRTVSRALTVDGKTAPIEVNFKGDFTCLK